MLRKNSEALQLGGAPCALYSALSNWTKLLEGLGDGGGGVPMIVHTQSTKVYLAKATLPSLSLENLATVKQTVKQKSPALTYVSSTVHTEG